MRSICFFIFALCLQSPVWGSTCELGGTSLNSGLQDLLDFSEAMTPESVKWSTPVHATLIDLAFPEESQLCRAQMNLGSMAADSLQFQGSKYAYMHAMRGEGEKVEDAKKNMEAFLERQYYRVRLHMKNYQRTNHDTDKLRACYRRGFALHPIMDSTSPVHAGYQVWQPFHIDNLFKHGDLIESMGKIGEEILRLPHSEEDMSALKSHPELKNKTIQLMRAIDLKMSKGPLGTAKKQ